MQVADISARANNNAKLRRARREFEANVPLPPSDEEKSSDSDVDMGNPEGSDSDVDMGNPEGSDDDDDGDDDDGEQKVGEPPQYFDAFGGKPPFQFRAQQQAKRRKKKNTTTKERRLKQERQQERRRREDRKQSVREAEEQRGKARRVGRIARRIEDRAGRDYDNRKVSAGRRVAGSKRKTPPARYRRDNKRQRGRGLNLASPDEMIDRLSLLFNSQSAGNISDELYNEASQIIDKLNTIGVLSSGEVKKLYKKFLSN
jgi:hypothetical protein